MHVLNDLEHLHSLMDGGESGIFAGRDWRQWKKSVMSEIFAEIGNAVTGVAGDVVHAGEQGAAAIGHAAEQAGTDIKNEFGKLVSGATTAPTPQVTSRPPAATEPEQWTAPNVDAGGQITVHHGALTDAANVIKKSVPEIESALGKIGSHTGAFGSLMGWATGKAFGGNLEAAVTAFHTAGTQTSEAHLDTAANTQGSRDTYDDAEQKSKQGASSISAGSGVSDLNIGAPGAAPGTSPVAGSTGNAAPAGGQKPGGQAGSGNWS